MDNLIKVAVSLVSIAGTDYNNDNFYIDGRYRREYEMERIQISVEKSSDLHIFGLTRGMDRCGAGMKTPVSMVKELKKFQNRIGSWGGDIDGKFEQMAECAGEINNIIYSMSISDPESKDKPSGFAGLLLDNGMAAALGTENNKIYLMREGKLKQLTGDKGRAERLLKAGIISREQARSLSSRLYTAAGESMAGMQKSEVFKVREGDIFLMCSENVGNALDDQVISEVLSKDTDPDYISNLMVMEAFGVGIHEGISVMVIKVEKLISSAEDFKSYRDDDYSSEEYYEDKGRNKNSGVFGFVAALITCIAVAVSLYFAYKELWPGKHAGESGSSLDQTIAADQTSSSSDEGNDSSQHQQSEVDENQADAGSDSEGDVSSGETDDAEPIVYIVQEGDTLQGISKKYYNDIEKYNLIMQANGLSDPDKLMVGQKLIIPKE